MISENFLFAQDTYLRFHLPKDQKSAPCEYSDC